MKRNWQKLCKTLGCILGIILLCGGCQPTPPQEGTDELTIVTTIFPAFDFARSVGGDKARVTMLLKPGMESHSFEPSPGDIIAINNCDLFIYNGGESDTWVDELLETQDSAKLHTLKMMDFAEGLDEEVVEGMQGETPLQDPEYPQEIAYDEHIWTSPKNAIRIVNAIAKTMSELDSKSQDIYEKNARAYMAQLQELDDVFRNIVSGGKRRMIIFGDRFPFRYFADAYGLSYRAAFPGCSAESEPSAKTVAYLIDKIQEEAVPNLFYIEFSNQRLARTLEEETGAKPLLFHSCHNLTKDEMDRGETYLSLMYANAENLKEALR